MRRLTPEEVAERLVLTAHGPLVMDRPHVPGVDEGVVALVVERFYGRVWEDGVLGPIFIAYVKDRAAHLEKMKAFWRQIVLRQPGYSGRPAQAHQGLPGMTEERFARWLGLFRLTVEETVPTPEGRAAFLDPAARMAARIRQAANTNASG